METKAPGVIDYGTRRRRSPWLMLGIASCLIAVAAGIYWQRGPLFRWWSMVQLRREVLAYDIPAGTTLFHQQPSDTRKSLLDSLIGTRHRVASKREMVWQLFPTPQISAGDPWTVFLHERWTPGGKHRVVLVEASATILPESTDIRLSVQLFAPGSIIDPAFTVLTVHPAEGMQLAGEIPGYTGVLPSVARVRHGADFRLLAGRPDPADSSAFLIDVVHDEKIITIKGRIGDDDSLSLSTSDGSSLPLQVKPR